MTNQRNYLELLHARRADGRRVCVGLDPEVDMLRLDDGYTNETAAQAQFELCMRVVKQTCDIALVYKPNFAFFAAVGGYGRLRELMGFIRRFAPDVPIILDVKRGDIGKTAANYAREAYGIYGADAVTINPYMGWDAIAPFIADPNKFAYLLCRTSNPSSAEIQNSIVDVDPSDVQAFGHDRARLYEYVAWRTDYRWDPKGNRLGLVVGATAPTELGEVRRIVGPERELLIPGVGSQGGKPEDVMRNGGTAIAVNSSSGIMFAEDPRQAALDLEAELLAAEASLV